jgi:DHA1 family bicyclomycin/chloramphenicol resistance-like MFS transporter
VDQQTPKAAPDLRDDGSTPWRLLLLLMSMTAIGSMSLNILVPAVPHLVKVLASDTETIQLTISLYMFGLALAQLFTGPLSDRFGRRPVILCGFSLATLASLAAIAASNAPVLIAARFLQAIGGATGVAVGRAIVRDLFGRERSAQMIGLIASAMAVAPMIAPFIGGLLETAFGWEAIFLFAAAASFGVLVWSWRTLPETRGTTTLDEARGSMALHVRHLFSSSRFYGYVLGAAFGSGAFFVFVGAGPHVIISIMQRSPTAYGLWFIPTAFGYILGNFITSRLSVRHGIDRMLWWGAVVELIGAILGVAVIPWINADGPLVLVAASTIMGVGNGIMLPNTIAGAVSIRPQAAGTASGTLGFIQMSFGALTAQLAGYLVSSAFSATPMLLHMLFMGVGCVLIFPLFLRSPAPAAK